MSDLLKRLAQYEGWGYPDVLRLRGSVLLNCAPVLFFTIAFTSLIAVLYEIYGYNVALPKNLVDTVTVVVGLLLGFRTNDAYGRYYEGRKLICSLSTEIRNACRNIWIGIRETVIDDRQEKEKYIKLLLAFVVAIKHHLRLEFGVNWYDLESLLPEVIQLAQYDGVIAQERSLRMVANRIPPSTYAKLRDSNATDETTIWFGAPEWSEIGASMSLPLEIIFHLALCIDERRNSIPDSTYSAISENLNSLVDIYANLERIGNTPIPYYYKIHLKQVVLIYVWTLPFALIEKLDWLVIPVVAVIGFILFGLEIIASKVGNPFGTRYEDLHIDSFIQDLEAEIDYMRRHIPSVKEIPR